MCRQVLWRGSFRDFSIIIFVSLVFSLESRDALPLREAFDDMCSVGLSLRGCCHTMAHGCLTELGATAYLQTHHTVTDIKIRYVRFEFWFSYFCFEVFKRKAIESVRRFMFISDASWPSSVGHFHCIWILEELRVFQLCHMIDP